MSFDFEKWKQENLSLDIDSQEKLELKICDALTEGKSLRIIARAFKIQKPYLEKVKAKYDFFNGKSK